MNFSYRRLRKKDGEKVLGLMKGTFLKYNGKGLSTRVVKEYMDFLTHGNFLIFLNQESFVALHGERIVGFVRGKNGRISNLFVDGKYHNRGIGRRLTELAENALGKKADKIKIRSSIYAIGFYTKLGYKKTTGKRKLHGIPMQPMAKILKK